MIYGQFWVPQFKWQLVDWLKKYDNTVNWNQFNKKRLYAIYFKIRRTKC